MLYKISVGEYLVEGAVELIKIFRFPPGAYNRPELPRRASPMKGLMIRFFMLGHRKEHIGQRSPASALHRPNKKRK
jgi:hypothetical protein